MRVGHDADNNRISREEPILVYNCFGGRVILQQRLVIFDTECCFYILDQSNNKLFIIVSISVCLSYIYKSCDSIDNHCRLGLSSFGVNGHLCGRQMTGRYGIRIGSHTH